MTRIAVIALIFVSCLTACANRPCCTDFVTVTPVRYIEPTEAPNSQFGWVETESNVATAFRVNVGNRQYFELYDHVGEKYIVDELALYAEKQVVMRKFCTSGKAQTKRKGLVGPHTGEYVSVLVECRNR